MLFNLLKTEVKAANALLERHGYGPDNFSIYFKDNNSVFCSVNLNEKDLEIWKNLLSVQEDLQSYRNLKKGKIRENPIIITPV
jgi:hypothetical protein